MSDTPSGVSSVNGSPAAHRAAVRSDRRSEPRVLARKVRKKLGEILVGDGVWSRTSSSRAKPRPARAGSGSARCWSRKGFATEVQVGSASPDRPGWTSWTSEPPKGPRLVDLSLVGEEIVRKHCVIPLSTPRRQAAAAGP